MPFKKPLFKRFSTYLYAMYRDVPNFDTFFNIAA
jgi:hypothetical protein